MLLLIMNKTQQFLPIQTRTDLLDAISIVCTDCADEIKEARLLRIQTRINLLDSISVLQVRQYQATNTTALYILVHAAQYLELQYWELMDQD